MTLWELAQSWEHSGGLIYPDDRCSGLHCHRCNLEKLLREKVSYYETISKCGIVPPTVLAQSVLDDLGVPESEATND